MRSFLIQTAIFWNIFHLSCYCSHNYKIYNLCDFPLRTSEFTGKYCSLSDRVPENISVQRPSTFSIHMIDRTLHNLSCWQNVPVCIERRHSNAKNTFYKTFCFLPFTNGPCELILIDNLHLLNKSATLFSNLERSYFQNVFFQTTRTSYTVMICST